ncbi:MAG: HAMP domain-containing histidine kinase [Lachnospiraceae bacterium]|nr:HAMP domain-containing histidine kinase [Lachnospiraceae bacterium]
MSHQWVELEGGEEGYYNHRISWWRVKELLYEAFLVLIIVWVLSLRLASVLYASRREKKIIHAASGMISDYMRYNRGAAEVFPEEYAELSLQAEELKVSMQRNEQMLKEEAARKNDLITYLAHDLKTPLTSVIGYLSLLEEVPEMPAAQKAKYTHIALDKAMRLEKLINEFFEITRYNLQQIILEKETVDLSFMLVQMTDEFYPILNTHGNTLRLELPPEKEGEEGITIYADSEKLARVFNNILKNAVAYSYPNTEILVSCREKAGKAVITFSNHGKTIPEQRLNAIFDKFFRLDDARSTNSGGAGLGLAIAREIVTLHGGSITADSRDEIITFTVTLPV